MSIADESSQNTGPMSSDLAMSEGLGATSAIGMAASTKVISSPLTSSREVSHVKTLAMPESKLESVGSGLDYGVRCGELLAKLDRDSWLWRTSQLCLDGTLAEFSQTWPEWGMSANGESYELTGKVCPIGENECFLLPTPAANGGLVDKLTVASLIRRGQKHEWGNFGEWLAQRYGKKPSPTLTETMMGFPAGWTACE